MTHEQLVYRITVELYDLKAKLERIRTITEKASLVLDNAPDLLTQHRSLLIDILNEIDTGEVYD